MTIGTREHAVLANDCYQDRAPKIGKEVPIGGADYFILDTDSRPSGYQATAYQRVDTGEVIIAHRGTESTKDGITDLGMTLHGRNNQLDDAIAFTQSAIEAAKRTQPNYPNPITISTTGHSLGGTLAELTAAKFNLPAETFNAYGPADLKSLQSYGIDIHAKHSDIINHVRATDVVAAGGRHLGEVHVYATAQDIESLRRGRYLDAPGLLRLPANPLLTADLSAHKMSNFLPDNAVTGASILTPENEARAQANRDPIGQYRQDVVNDRIDLAMIANRAPSPLQAINPLDPSTKLRLQAMDAGAIAAAEVVADGLAHSGRAARQGIKAIGDGASRAYDSAFGSKPTMPPPLPRLDQAGHYDHALFKQAQAGVHRLDAELGRTPDASSDNLAAALVVAARREGVSRIDGVVLNNDASKAFAVQGSPRSPLMKFASVSTVEAINTPIAQSTQALAEVIRDKAQAQAQQNVEHQTARQAQRDAGPSMAM
jgi:hypothetical protein